MQNKFRDGLWRSWKVFYRSVCTRVATPKFRVCVVGSGPAAMYSVECLLRFQATNAVVTNRLGIDVLERLPTPFGLLRYGVAPDHPEVRNVEGKFQELLSHPQVRFFGNIEVGRDISVSELRNLNSRRDYTVWCLFCKRFCCLNVVVIGQGNVALDVARIIGKQAENLKKTDISSVALDCLARSSVQNIYIVGRRGPVQASWTAKELRECLYSVKGLQPCFEKEELVISDVDREELSSSRSTRRCFDLITKCFAEQSGSQEQQFARKLHLRFLWTPIAFQGYNDNTKVDNRHENRLCFTLFRRNRLTGSSGRQKPVLLEESAGNVYWNQSCELAFRSIGYKGKPFELVPFDERAGVVPNKCGRVLSRVEQTSEEEELFEKGLYVVGWLKRGPTGIVGSNKWDAEETVNVVAEDILSLAKTDTHNFSVREDLQDVLRTRNIAFVNFEGWKRIDEEERRRGQRKGIEREKMLTWEELLDFGVVGSVYKSQGDESELVTKK
ncbi:hypothetical protein GAYE_SCF02G2066 [Galdieria yellowstonensis]|uniref:NADPH:adrenodoxin oxidoreductase, mitochondrial n=1 Tax=Galdieria yellowstonensis TaxID=3028027 RepID=A0AAV9I9W1_9RHOD|nr:hypothetical protein GAYE_SCF02G2066 [Galdieria yellowstonensis]